MGQIDYKQLPEDQLQPLYKQEGDKQAFFEFHQRYKLIVQARWRASHQVLFRKYPEEFEDFFDKLLEEAVTKWDKSKASFRTFFLMQVCRRRVIDFTRSLWTRYRREAKAVSELGSPGGGVDAEASLDSILEEDRRSSDEEPTFSEQDLEFFREALPREKQDCQELLRLMIYSGPRKFEEKARVLAIMGYTKKATGWRDTWMRNRRRIMAYIEGRRNGE